MSVPTSEEGLRALPEAAFQLNIPPLMPVMTALVTAIVLGITAAGTKATAFEKALEQFEGMMMVVKKMVIPVLPFFIATTFADLVYQCTLTQQLPVFLKVVVLLLIGHAVWLAVLYGSG